MAFRLLPKIPCKSSLKHARARSFSVESEVPTILKSNVKFTCEFGQDAKSVAYHSIRRRSNSQPNKRLFGNNVEQCTVNRFYSNEIKEFEGKPEVENRSKCLSKSTTATYANQKGRLESSAKDEAFSKNQQEIETSDVKSFLMGYSEKKTPRNSSQVDVRQRNARSGEETAEEQLENKRKDGLRFALADSRIRDKSGIEKEIKYLRDAMKEQILNNRVHQNSQKQVMRLQEVAERLLVKEREAKKSEILVKLPNLIEQYEMKNKMKQFGHTNLQPQNLSPFRVMSPVNSAHLRPTAKGNSKQTGATHKFGLERNFGFKPSSASKTTNDRRQYSTNYHCQNLPQELSEIEMVEEYIAIESEFTSNRNEQDALEETMDFIQQFRQDELDLNIIKSGFMDPITAGKSYFQNKSEKYKTQQQQSDVVYEEVFLGRCDKKNARPISAQKTSATNENSYVEVDIHQIEVNKDVEIKKVHNAPKKFNQIARVLVKEGNVEIEEHPESQVVKMKSMKQINRILNNYKNPEFDCNKKLEISAKQGSLQISDVKIAKKFGNDCCPSYSDMIRKKFQDIEETKGGRINSTVSLKNIEHYNVLEKGLKSTEYQNSDKSPDYSRRQKALNIGKTKDSNNILTKKLSRSVTNYTKTSSNFSSCTQIFADKTNHLKTENMPRVVRAFKEDCNNLPSHEYSSQIHSSCTGSNSKNGSIRKYAGSNVQNTKTPTTNQVNHVLSRNFSTMQGFQKNTFVTARKYGYSNLRNIDFTRDYRQFMSEQTKRFKHSRKGKKGKNKRKCKTKKKKRSKRKAKGQQDCCPEYVSNNPDCVCIIPKIPDKMPLLKRLSKPPKKDINWEAMKKCRTSKCEYIRDEGKLKDKQLPPPPLSPCCCIEPLVPDKLPKLRRLPKFMRVDKCWKDFDKCNEHTYCTKQVRADSLVQKKQKILPCLHNSRCPPRCPMEPDKKPPMKRLRKPKIKDPIRKCPRKKKLCPERADECLGYREKKLPKPPLSCCPPPYIPQPDATPKMKRLKKFKIKVKRVCPVKGECDETLRSDYCLEVDKKRLPCLLPAPRVWCDYHFDVEYKPLPVPVIKCPPKCDEDKKSPPKCDEDKKSTGKKSAKKKSSKQSKCKKEKSKKCYSTMAGENIWQGSFTRRNLSTTGITYKLSDYLGTCPDNLSLPNCEKAKDKNCASRVALPSCCKEDAPYPSFSEIGERRVHSGITQCAPMSYLQPKRPVLGTITVSKPPPPMHAPIDPKLEEQCVMEKLKYKSKGNKKSCEDFYCEDQPLLKHTLLQELEEEAKEAGNVSTAWPKSKAAPGRLADPHICPVVDMDLCEGLEPELKMPDEKKRRDDYLSCKKEADEEAEVCAERAEKLCTANEYPSVKADKSPTSMELCVQKELVDKCKMEMSGRKRHEERDEHKERPAKESALVPITLPKGKNANFKQTLWERVKSFLRAKPGCPRPGNEHHPSDCYQYSNYYQYNKDCDELPDCEERCKKTKQKPKVETPPKKECAGDAAEKQCAQKSSRTTMTFKIEAPKITSANEIPNATEVAEVCIDENKREEKPLQHCRMGPECSAPSIRLPNCPPRTVCDCNQRSEMPKCKTVEPPYMSFSECHMFRKLRLNEKQIADLRAKMTKKTFDEMQKLHGGRCFCTFSRSFSSGSGGSKPKDIFKYFECVSDETIRDMDDYQLAEKILDCIKDGLNALEQGGDGANDPMYEVYKELQLITLEELKQCERYLDVRDKGKAESYEDEERDVITYSCKFGGSS